MRKVGEAGFSRVPTMHKTRDYFIANKKHTKVTCKKCGLETFQSLGQIRKFHTLGFMCFTCRKEDKDELKQAILALAKRKIKAAKQSK